jgi:hypothetical protein
MRFGAFLLPAAAAKHDELKGTKYPGANPTYYQRSLNEHARVIKQLEDLGFDFVAFSEHHFHLEGLEISNNPILLGPGRGPRSARSWRTWQRELSHCLNCRRAEAFA